MSKQETGAPSMGILSKETKEKIKRNLAELGIEITPEIVDAVFIFLQNEDFVDKKIGILYKNDPKVLMAKIKEYFNPIPLANSEEEDQIAFWGQVEARNKVSTIEELRGEYKMKFGVDASSYYTKERIQEALKNPNEEEYLLFKNSRDEDAKDRESDYRR